MSEKCDKCGFLFCDCQAIEVMPEPVQTRRRPSSVRQDELRIIIEDYKAARITKEEVLRLRAEIYALMQNELALMKQLTAVVFGQQKEKVLTFADFPLAASGKLPR